MLQTVLASELWEHSAGIAGRGMVHADHGVVRPQTLEAKAVGIGARN